MSPNINIVLLLTAVLMFFKLSKIIKEFSFVKLSNGKYQVVENDPILGNLNYQELIQYMKCRSKYADPRKEIISGKYWVFFNFFKSKLQFGCTETVTYTTHGDHNFLENLGPLVYRWEGPVSVSVFCPRSDYSRALKTIMYLRQM